MWLPSMLFKNVLFVCTMPAKESVCILCVPVNSARPSIASHLHFRATPSHLFSALRKYLRISSVQSSVPFSVVSTLRLLGQLNPSAVDSPGRVALGASGMDFGPRAGFMLS